MVRIDVFAVAGGVVRGRRGPPRRGDLDGADEAYRHAHEIGRDPQPGLALLRLAQGRVDAARASIATAIAAFGGSRLERAPLHAAQVDIALAAGDLDTAAASADEVMETARSFESIGLRAVGLRVAGMPSRSHAAKASLRSPHCGRRAPPGTSSTRPYEAARTRVLLADAYALLDDDDGADRERAAARACFERLGAQAALRALDGDGAGPTASPSRAQPPRAGGARAGRPGHDQP